MKRLLSEYIDQKRRKKDIIKKLLKQGFKQDLALSKIKQDLDSVFSYIQCYIYIKIYV